MLLAIDARIISIADKAIRPGDSLERLLDVGRFTEAAHTFQWGIGGRGSEGWPRNRVAIACTSRCVPGAGTESRTGSAVAGRAQTGGRLLTETRICRQGPAGDSPNSRDATIEDCIGGDQGDVHELRGGQDQSVEGVAMIPVH